MATLVDRFVCRREGHVPMFTVQRATGVILPSYITTCVRCGRAYEMQRPEGVATSGLDKE